MADSTTLHDAFIDELRDTYDAEKQLTKALPKLAKAATSADLRDAFEAHLEETRGQIERLEQVFEALGEKARGKHCEGIAGIIEEGKAIMEEDFDETTMDACLIAAGQRAEHYEMAAYGTLVAWAQAMGHNEAAALLQETLEEEKAADEKLTTHCRERHQSGCGRSRASGGRRGRGQRRGRARRSTGAAAAQHRQGGQAVDPPLTCPRSHGHPVPRAGDGMARGRGARSDRASFPSPGPR